MATVLNIIFIACFIVSSFPSSFGMDFGKEMQFANVHVSLTPEHAPSDIHGHSNKRTGLNESMLSVYMDSKRYWLKLSQTSWLVAPGASIKRVGVGGQADATSFPLVPRPCLYLVNSHANTALVGTLSLCHKDGPRIVLMEGEEVTELLPHKVNPPRVDAPPFPIGIEPPHISKRGPFYKTFTHIVKRQSLPAGDDPDCHVPSSHPGQGGSCGRDTFPPHPSNRPHPGNIPGIHEVLIDPTTHDFEKRAGLLSDPLIVELGMFLDQALIDTFTKFLSSEEELVDLVLGLVNNVQSLYRHPSLGRTVHLTITHLRILKVQPHDLPTHQGDRIQLLKSFCSYNQRNNDPSDSSPQHWDIGVYLSGLNFYEKSDDGTHNGVTMGLAYTGGVCDPALSCVINELGAVDYRGRPYPSAGALSSYVLAHEIGHSLGLRHDGVSNQCSQQGYIMAAGRGLRGATTWSSCARDKLQLQKGTCLEDGGENDINSADKPWDHGVYEGLPGQKWDATAQCRLFLRDDDAILSDTSRVNEVCESVECVTPKRISTYLAGPALEGTHCGGENWCQGGQCVPWGNRQLNVVVGGWGPWSHSKCMSGCVKGATGYKLSRRVCDSPKPKNSVKGCVGVEVVISFCQDDEVCSYAPRKTVTEVASELCGEVAKLKGDIMAEGRQMSYSSGPDMAWQACALYCQKVNSTSFWTPRFEFKNMPQVPTHLPDGTPCNNGEYVCYDRECVPRETTVTNIRTAGDFPTHHTMHHLPVPRKSQSGDDYPEIDVDDLFS